jgi:tetratricopeptide (TPR) repeat protein
MVDAGSALSASQVARLRAAAGLLSSGRRTEALAAARALAEEAVASADVRQLLAMCLAEAGQVEAAEDAFRHAMALAGVTTDIAVNLARWLGRLGRVEEALQVLSEVPPTAASRLQQGLLALRAGQHLMARDAFEQSVAREPALAPAWHGLGQARRALGDWEAAAVAFDEATRLAPGDARAWINRAAVLRLLGGLVEAMACLDHAEQLGYPGPELGDLRNGLWHDAGEPGLAIIGARTLVRRFPDDIGAQAALAQLLWEHGDDRVAGADPFAEFLRAAGRQPGHRELHLRLGAMLIAAGRARDALALLGPLQDATTDDPVVRWFRADAYACLGEHTLAGGLYQAAHARLHRLSAGYLNAYARHAFHVGEPDLALRCAAEAITLDPWDQEAWAHRATAWRLLGDPREFWLCDYDRLIGEVEVRAPRGYADMPDFLTRLEERLGQLHGGAGQEPLNQSVRGGSQTPGRLFGRNDAIFRDAGQAMRAAVETWVATLPTDDHHPFLSRRGPGVRFVGSWSVRLRSSGRHSNHIHNEGWLSSAFYVALPASLRTDKPEDRAGWIQFGQPLEELGLDLAPRRMIRPAPGKLVLFPSYLWHGTIPFSDVESRLTIAFDGQPTQPSASDGVHSGMLNMLKQR